MILRNKNKEKRFTLVVSDKMHKELKRRCIIKETTIKDYIINAIEFYQNDQENHKLEFNNGK